jgi:hypothetical protein
VDAAAVAAARRCVGQQRPLPPTAARARAAVRVCRAEAPARLALHREPRDGLVVATVAAHDAGEEGARDCVSPPRRVRCRAMLAAACRRDRACVCVCVCVHAASAEHVPTEPAIVVFARQELRWRGAGVAAEQADQGPATARHLRQQPAGPLLRVVCVERCPSATLARVLVRSTTTS